MKNCLVARYAREEWFSCGKPDKMGSLRSPKRDPPPCGGVARRSEALASRSQK